MKKYYIGAVLLFSTLATAQQGLVGINTEKPEASLHITDFGATNGVIDAPRNKVGLKIPTHEALPDVAFSTEAEKNLSKEKNAMLIHLDRPASATKEALQGFYYWDDNAYSWQNIIDNRQVNLDTSKIIITGSSLTNNINGASNEKIVFDNIKTFDDDFTIDTNTNEIIVGKPASYYLLLIGSIEKQGGAGGFTLNINNNNESLISSSVSVAADANGEYRTANFYISKIVKLEKNDRLSASVYGYSDVSSAYVKSPFSITLIKLD